MWPRQIDAAGELDRLVVKKSGDRIHVLAHNCFRSQAVNLLDFDATFRRSHQHGFGSGTIVGDAEVDFLLDVGGRVNQHRVHHMILDRHSKDFSRAFLCLFRRPGQFDAAGLATSTYQHLRLDNNRALRVPGERIHLYWRVSDVTNGNRDTEIGETLF